MKEHTFTVGIAAKNEEETIYKCLTSVCDEVGELSCKADAIIVCLNNCTDRTEEEVKRFTKNHRSLKIIVRHCDGNLIDAQRAILSAALVQPVVFVDADIRLGSNAIKRLLEAFDDPAVHLAYGSSVSHGSHYQPWLLARMYSAKKYGGVRTERRYFSGRLFVVRDWYFPTKDEFRQRAMKTNSNYLLKYGGGLMLDDVYLSAYLIAKYGPQAIRPVDGAEVYYCPVRTWRDWWRTYRRIQIEVTKIEVWFPEFRHVREHFYRRVNWKKVRQLSLVDKVTWLLYISLKYGARFLVVLELMVAKKTRYTPEAQWQPTESTKIVE